MSFTINESLDDSKLIDFIHHVLLLKYGGVHRASARGHRSEEALQGVSVPG